MHWKEKHSKMEQWSNIQIGSNICIIKFDRNSDVNQESFTFWLCNFKKLWSESLNSKDELFQRFKDYNPTTNDDEITNQLIEALGTREKYTEVNADIKSSDNEIKFEFALQLNEGVSMKFYWLLKKCDEQIFFEQITKPMMHQIGDKNKLIEIVKKKDDEIGQYKLVCTESLRKRFITQPFQESDMTSMFDCEIEQFESIIGPLKKNIDKDIAKNDTVSPAKSPFAASKRGRNRLRPAYQDIVKPGVTYDPSDDDDDEVKIETEAAQVKAEIVESPPEPSAKKRIRRDLNL